MKKKTTNQFIEEAREIHGDKYDYSLVEYTGALRKIKIICPIHGVFEQIPNSHIQGTGCIKCRNEAFLKTTNQFIEEAREIHGDKYDYSLVEYQYAKSKTKIICPIHGLFEQTPDSHIQGAGCPMCVGNKRSSTNQFIEEAREIHGDKYDYSLVEYTGTDNLVVINCKEHGIFKQTPYKHLKRKQGCPKCKSSHGEREIFNFLKSKNIKFAYQYCFPECRVKRPLPFDFYIEEYKICIEYQGIQHFKPIEFWGGIDSLNRYKKYDKIKEDFCAENNISLIKILYNEDVKEKLNLSFTFV